MMLAASQVLGIVAALLGILLRRIDKEAGRRRLRRASRVLRLAVQA
jgi:hypothetical protein